MPGWLTTATSSVAQTGGKSARGQSPAGTCAGQPQRRVDHDGLKCRPNHPQDGVTRQDVTDTCRATLQKLITAADKLGPTEEGASPPCIPSASLSRRSAYSKTLSLSECTWAAIIQLFDDVAEVPEGVSARSAAVVHRRRCARHRSRHGRITIGHVPVAEADFFRSAFCIARRGQVGSCRAASRWW